VLFRLPGKMDSPFLAELISLIAFFCELILHKAIPL